MRPAKFIVADCTNSILERLKLKIELIFGDFEHFRSNINTSLLDAKMIFFGKFLFAKSHPYI